VREILGFNFGRLFDEINFLRQGFLLWAFDLL
jgi:hypothetical protein